MTTPAFTFRQLHQIREVLQALDHLPASAAANRRKNPRVNIHLPLSVRLLSSPALPTVRVFTRNLSVSGIAFLAHRTFTLGEHMVLYLPVPECTRLILCQVVFCHYLRAGLCEIGATFIQAAPKNGMPRIPTAWLRLSPTASLHSPTPSGVAQ